MSSGSPPRGAGLALLARGLRTRLALAARGVVVLAACGGVLAACGGDDPATASGPGAAAGDALAPLSVEDLPTGFEPINFYHDIPGLLRETGDPVLTSLGRQGEDPATALGQGFASDSGELLFAIEIGLPGNEEAQEAVAYIGALEPAAVLAFISPDEILFEHSRAAAPAVGDAAAHYTLRYGATGGGVRTRDVASDLLIFASGRTVVFLLRSVSTTDFGGSAAVDLETVAAQLHARLQGAETRRS